MLDSLQSLHAAPVPELRSQNAAILNMGRPRKYKPMLQRDVARQYSYFAC